MSKAPAQLDATPIAEIFAALAESVQKELKSDDDVVDLELRFHSVHIEKRGIFFRSNQKESSAEVRMATQIRSKRAE
ncbi:MAG: hypothetical protein KF902_13880 [Phycisphaeraceae bacterium]|nr:hypothetical protein [Phycisphaeraceae bacterium]